MAAAYRDYLEAWLNRRMEGPYDRTDAELAAGVTPMNYAYEPGDARRYGATGSSNDTTFLRNWLLACAGAPYRAYLPPASTATKYITDPLTIPDDIHIVVDRDVILEARTGYGSTDVLLNFDGASNVTMECNEAIFRMLKSEYTTGEHRHCFNLLNCSNVLIKNPKAIDSGGDGYYINAATNLTIENPLADNNRRQGMSIIGATNLRITGIMRLINTTGTAPQFGLAIEPNSTADDLININIDTVEVTDNAGGGVSIFLDDYKTGTPDDVSISIKKIISRSNSGNALRVRNVFLNAGSYGGYIDIGEILSEGDAAAAVYIEDKALGAPLLHIGKVTAINPCTGSISFADTGAVYLADTSAAASGGIHIDSVSAKATHTDMDYGVVLEMGGGYTDVRIRIENVRGYQVAPVRYNNITQTVAAATDAIIDTSKLRDEVALTANTSIVATAHVGRFITNTGATGNIAHTLNGYPPPGNPYKFRITAAHQVSIDVASASDRILGTTAGGNHIVSSTVGEEVELHYAGTIGGVHYWHARILGNASNWTFT